MQQEPFPETTEGVEISNDSTFEDNQKEICRIQAEIIQLIKKMQILEKEQNKSFKKISKSIRKKRKNKTETKRKPSGFETPVKIPELFLEFIVNGLETKSFSEKKSLELGEFSLTRDSMIPRSLITGTVYDYIKTRELYMEPQEIQDIVARFPELKEHFKNANTTEKNKRFPHVDNAIRKLFTLEENEILTFYNFQKYVTRLFPKIKSDLITNDTETDMYNESFEHSNMTTSVSSVIAESSC
jgi:hypothetical protein